MTAHTTIEEYIKRYKRGDLIVPADFRGKGSETAIRQTLSRLTKEGVIKRLGHGLYILPKKDPIFGDVLPSAEEIAKALAAKEKIKIRPAGAQALHKLGLTTQVPTKLVYITNGNNRTINIGRITIRFKATSPKKLALSGELSSLIIPALEELGIDQITDVQKTRLVELINKENRSKLNQDLKLASASVHDFLLKLIKSDSMA